MPSVAWARWGGCSGCSWVVECADFCDDDEPSSYWRVWLLLLLRQSLCYSRCRSRFLECRTPTARIARVPGTRRAVEVQVRMSTLTSALVMNTLILTAVVFVVSDTDESTISMWTRRGQKKVMWMRGGGLVVFGRYQGTVGGSAPGSRSVGKKSVQYNHLLDNGDAF